MTLLACAAAKSLQSCPTLCNPIDGSPPGSAVPGFSRQEHWSGLPFPSAFSKTSLNIWKFTVHILLKPGLENFEHYFTSM